MRGTSDGHHAAASGRGLVAPAHSPGTVGGADVVVVGNTYAGTCTKVTAPGASIKLDNGAGGLLNRKNCSVDTSGGRRVPSKGARLYVKVLRIKDDDKKKKKLVLSTLGLDPAADQALARTQIEEAPADAAEAPLQFFSTESAFFYLQISKHVMRF